MEDDEIPSWMPYDNDDMDNWSPVHRVEIDTVDKVWRSSIPFIGQLAATSTNSEGVWPSKGEVIHDEEGAIIYQTAQSKEAAQFVKDVVAIISFLEGEDAVHVLYTNPHGEIKAENVFGKDSFDRHLPRMSELYLSLLGPGFPAWIDETSLAPEVIAAFTSKEIARYQNLLEECKDTRDEVLKFNGKRRKRPFYSVRKPVMLDELEKYENCISFYEAAIDLLQSFMISSIESSGFLSGD